MANHVSPVSLLNLRQGLCTRLKHLDDAQDVLLQTQQTIQRLLRGINPHTLSVVNVSERTLQTQPLRNVSQRQTLPVDAETRIRFKYIVLAVPHSDAPQCRLTTQAQRPGPREAWIATVTRWPGSLQRMVRPRWTVSVSISEHRLSTHKTAAKMRPAETNRPATNQREERPRP